MMLLPRYLRFHCLNRKITAFCFSGLIRSMLPAHNQRYKWSLRAYSYLPSRGGLDPITLLRIIQART